MKYTGEPITVAVKLAGERWWVWLADTRVIGFKDKPTAIAVLVNIVDALRAKGIAAEERVVE